jgi:hypothetical protein
MPCGHSADVPARFRIPLQVQGGRGYGRPHGSCSLRQPPLMAWALNGLCSSRAHRIFVEVAFRLQSAPIPLEQGVVYQVSV